jgi:hypothetical protein
MKPRLLATASALAGLLTAPPLAGQQSTPSPSIDFTGPPGSSKPFLTATPTGGLLLTWFEPRPEKRWALRIAARDATRWSEPRTVLESDRFFVNWADFPSAVETATGDWVVHWLEKTEAKPYAYHVRVSRSRDQGRQWSAPLTAHSDRSATEHGFVAMVPNPDGTVSVAWLDGRQMATDSAGTMSVRAATLRPDGTVTGETVLDGRTCECCQVAMARAGSGLVVAYRDRSAEEVRDIAVVRELGGRWSEPRLVHADGWVWRACPVNGPAIDASGQDVVVAWFTAANGEARVKAAFSVDGGVSFGRPVTIDEGNPLGRTQVRLLQDGTALVGWLEAVGDSAAWRARRLSRSGNAGSAVTLGHTARTREAGFARLDAQGGDLVAAWSEPGPEGKVIVTRLPLSALPRR